MVKLNRREFFQMTGAALAAAKAGALVSGCHSEAAKPETTRWRIHFNLSNFTGGESFKYHDFNGATALQQHDRETVERAKSEAPHLQLIADDAFTHYVDADLPVQLVSTAYVTRSVTVDGSAQDLLVHMQDNVPLADGIDRVPAKPHYHPSSRAFLRGGARRLMNLHSHPSDGDDDGCTHVAGGNDGFVCADGTVAVTPGECLDQYVETVLSLLKKHPSLVKLDPEVHLTMEALLTAEGQDDGGLYRSVVELAVLLKGYETCEGGWAELKKYKRYEDKVTDYQIDGAPVYGFNIKEEVMRQLVEPVSNFVERCRNLPAFKDVIWTHATAVPDSAAAVAPQADTKKTVDVDCSSGDGVSVDVDFSGFGARALSITINNTRLRHLGIYYRYLDADEKPIPLDTLGTFATKADTHHVYGDMLSSVLMVVDIWKFDTYKTIVADWPEEASYVELILGGPGHGADSDYATKGIVWSVILEMAVPTALAIGGVALGSKKAYIELMEESEIKLAAGVVGGFLLSGKAGFDYGMSGGNGWTILADFANTLLPLLIDTGVSVAVAKYMGKSSLVTASPLIRVFVQMGTIGLYLGQMGRTTSDWINSNKISTRTLSIHYDARVTVHHDPREADGFPKQAATYQIKRIYQKMNRVDASPVVELGAPETWPQTIDYTFKAVPSGGRVKVIAQLISEGGWVAAQGQTDWLLNTEQDAGSVTIVVMNNIVPLTHETTYEHSFLADKDTAYRWKKTSVKPPGTIDYLSPGNDRISELGALTLDQKKGLLGYDWRASGTGLHSCTSPADSLAQLNVFQTLNSFGSAEATRIFPACAFINQVMLAYDYLPSLFLIKYWITPSVIGKLMSDDSIDLSQATLAALNGMAIDEETEVDVYDSAVDPPGVYRGQKALVREVGARLGTQPDKLLLAKILDYCKKTWSLTDDDKPIPDPDTITLGNYIIDPRKAKGSDSPYYFVSGIIAEKNTGYALPSISSDEPVTYGKFIHRPTAVTLTSNKQLVAVNRDLHLLQSLDLNGGLYPYMKAPPAVIRAGKGSEKGAGTVLGPVGVVGTYDGNILVLESTGGFHRVQAFTATFENAAIFTDSAGNATPYIYLDTGGVPTRFLDITVESRGYIYILGYVNAGSEISDYRLTIYDPTGQFLAQTEGVNAGRIAVDMWRTLYALNYSPMPNSGIVEPSLSIWLPSIPGG